MAKLFNKTLFSIRQIISCIENVDVENITVERAKVVRQRLERLNMWGKNETTRLEFLGSDC